MLNVSLQGRPQVHYCGAKKVKIYMIQTRIIQTLEHLIIMDLSGYRLTGLQIFCCLCKRRVTQLGPCIRLV